MANVTLPVTGASGSVDAVIETIDGPGGAQREIVAISDLAGNNVDSIGGLTETAPASDTASSGLNGRLQRIAQRLTSMIGLLPAALTAGGNLSIGSTIANPVSTLTRPGTSGFYAQNTIVASSATAGSIAVPSFAAAAGSGGSGSLLSFLLRTNATSGMGTTSFAVDFWSFAPTFTNGDRAAYAVATGASGWLGSCSFASMTQVGDGAYGQAVPDAPVASIDFDLVSGTSIFWSLKVTNTAGFSGIASQTFVLTSRVQQN